MTKGLDGSHTPTPSGRNQVWHPATGRSLLTNRVYAGHARYNYRQPATPPYRTRDLAQLHSLKTGRRYRPPTEWVRSDAPAMIAAEVFHKAQVPWQRNAGLAHKMSQPTSRRSWLRRLVTCGECGLGMVCNRQQSVCKTYESLYYGCRGHAPLPGGRLHACPSRRGRADRLDAVVWQALSQLLQAPTLMPHLPQSWAQAQPQQDSTRAAQHPQLLQRRQRLERQSQR
jgi:hypothetical protein